MAFYPKKVVLQIQEFVKNYIKIICHSFKWNRCIITDSSGFSCKYSTAKISLKEPVADFSVKFHCHNQ